MFYDRKIRYLNYYEAGERIRGSGFVKLEARDKTLRFEISVKGVRDIAGTFPILLLGAGKEKVFEQLTFREGRGEHRCICRLEEGIGETGIPYSELSGIRIPLAGGREIACLWDGIMSHQPDDVKTQSLEPQKFIMQSRVAQKRAAQGNAAREQVTSGQTAQEPIMPERAAQGNAAREQVTSGQAAQEPIMPERVAQGNAARGQGVSGQTAQEPIMPERAAQGNAAREQVTSGQAAQEPMMPERAAQGNDIRGQAVQDVGERSEKAENKKSNSSIEWVEKTENKDGKNRGESVPESTQTMKQGREETVSEEEKMISLQEDKWTQLCTIYPHIKPFRDEREYLSISPADFVLLPAANYRAAHNSFLLHGYYNYHHLILARMERRGEILYYLGVPGNYFEKEKQVAVMFGFESFECADEPAEYGDFGYYMMRTDI